MLVARSDHTGIGSGTHRDTLTANYELVRYVKLIVIASAHRSKPRNSTAVE